MGWSLRKSWRLLSGIRISLSKSGPRLSVGIPGARASIDMHGRTKIYGGRGPIRFQKSFALGKQIASSQKKTNRIKEILGVFRKS